MSRNFAWITVWLFVASNMSISAAPPFWWTDDQANTRILQQGSVAENYAPANLGQLKWVASQAKKHFDVELAPFGGAGSEIDALVASFTPPGGHTEATRAANYAPANLGQLKNVAKAFYDRLLFLGYDTRQNLIDHGLTNWSHDYPWDPGAAWNQVGPADKSPNYVPANLGQLKLVFCFDLGDRNNDGLPDWWEDKYEISSGASGNSDTDGMSNFYEYWNQLNPTMYDADEDRDGDGIPNREDARPANASIGRLSISIANPANGNILP